VAAAGTGLAAEPGWAEGAGQANPVLAEVIRSGVVESRHRGSLVVLAADGSEAIAVGAASQPMFPRSSNKPMQAAAMLRCGLELDGRLLALAAASHSGEEFHIAGVREILGLAGLAESDLQCPPDLPLDESARNTWLRAGGDADRVHMNCSGKHAAMLATCVAAGWPTASYRDPAHPLQARIRQTVTELAGEPVTATGVDGCGAPLLAISVAGLARAFRALVLAGPGSAERRVADAMRSNPAWTSGTTRPEAAMVGAVPGLLMKSGAEGVCAFALADGRAAAVKFDDGAQRAPASLMAALLLDLIGAAPVPGSAPGQVAVLAGLAAAPVFGGGVPVGEIRPVLPR
jgi:L-asparaginase II